MSLGTALLTALKYTALAACEAAVPIAAEQLKDTVKRSRKKMDRKMKIRVVVESTPPDEDGED